MYRYFCNMLHNNDFFFSMYNCKKKQEINVFHYVNNRLLTKNVYRGFQFDQSRLQTQGVLELSTQGQETLGEGIGVHLSPVKARLYMKGRKIISVSESTTWDMYHIFKKYLITC